ncbi:Maf family protein [Phaeovulum vinaykumarii]|uniref:Nucleoside triphosphate pyrophosphatase n=1 Tax=Phaeovulum vinaykumarii TaxID=407234 RepID=A0A1N7MAW8_9RHOB|nr:nucleoside triphosphate pyrophosphatase [Phaeovulum vinaykumarii]SIS83207.1 septum formation protein [Phaeovulum vinaykumarii]SOC10366.1 septum formation protein [Phaeovulum vinaykumarii]
MHTPLILASASETRARLLRNTGILPVIQPARLDEAAIRDELSALGLDPARQAEVLAERKAMTISARNAATIVLGGDQILDCEGRIFAKPHTQEETCAQIAALSGRQHRLTTAVVAARGGEILWRHTVEAHLTMHQIPEPEIRAYVARNWPGLKHSVGGYKIEEEGLRLFSRIEGDYFSILGLPLVEFLTFLREKGDIGS